MPAVAKRLTYYWIRFLSALTIFFLPSVKTVPMQEVRNVLLLLLFTEKLALKKKKKNALFKMGSVESLFFLTDFGF